MGGGNSKSSRESQHSTAWDSDSETPYRSREIRAAHTKKLLTTIQTGSASSLLLGVLNSTNEGVIVSDLHGTIILANCAIQRMFGHSAEDLTNESVSILMPRRFALSHDVFMYKYTRSGTSKIMGRFRQLHGMRKDGTEFPVEVMLSDMTADGQLLIVAMIRDITEVVRNLELAERLIDNMLPSSVAKRIRESQDQQQLIADNHTSATVMFCDIVGFTSFSTTVRPEFLVKLLNDLFNEFDEATARFSIEKIKTIGDSYMCASGVPQPNERHAVLMIEFAKETRRLIQQFNMKHNTTIQMRWGINSGPVIAGVIGHKKLVYDLWGDTVNIASRMESTGRANRIHVSQSTMELAQSELQFEERGTIDVKGVGEMRTYFVVESDLTNEIPSLDNIILSSDDTSSSSNSLLSSSCILPTDP